MKRAFIVHRWDGSPKTDWYPWLKKELENEGFVVKVPTMPDPGHPEIELWVKTLARTAETPDENCYFIGHSVGCQTILRYLQTVNTKVAGIVLVAGWLTLKGLTPQETAIARPWLETPIDYKQIRKIAPKITAVFSDNDPWVPLENVQLFKEKLGAKTVIEKNKGHYTETTELQTALDAVLEIANDA